MFCLTAFHHIGKNLTKPNFTFITKRYKKYRMVEVCSITTIGILAGFK